VSLLLSLLLESDDTRPLIIDQPEDELDKSYLFETVLPALHRLKGHRQVIFATHDANIVVNGDADQVADHRLDISADIADFGELGGFDFDKGGAGQLGQAACDLGLANARGTDHQDVLRQDVVALGRRQLLASIAVSKGDCDGSLGGPLADDIVVEEGYDLPWSQVFNGKRHSSSIYHAGGLTLTVFRNPVGNMVARPSLVWNNQIGRPVVVFVFAQCKANTAKDLAIAPFCDNN
jgi:hypothetical protein